jgi:hypothetical protein
MRGTRFAELSAFVAVAEHRNPTRDRCALASRRLPPVLTVEIPVRWRPATNRRGPTCADPTDERGQSAVGRRVDAVLRHRTFRMLSPLAL